jgi:serine-type D-Ala-D-Ala carboxypeptidase/endopeptidase (penicillin-binding protein 4)
MRNTSNLICLLCLLLLNACSISSKISRDAQQQVLQQPVMAPAHVGISIMDAATGEYLYNYQGDKYFVPASNTKLFTCYAALRYLGDSLTALRYVDKGKGVVEVEGNADPTFLLSEYAFQPAYHFLKQQNKILLSHTNWKEPALGAGWAWDDYSSDYMPERSVFPVYGNLAQFQKNLLGIATIPAGMLPAQLIPADGKFSITRSLGSDSFYTVPANKPFRQSAMPFRVGTASHQAKLLADTLHTTVESPAFRLERWPDVVTIKSQPTDSVLSTMMHRSDNFFAEQLLLMVSNERFAVMNTKMVVDSLLNNDLNFLPQKPKWVDGSGLSRYNLFTPQDFIAVLQAMKSGFDWKRITAILPTGNEGTLSGLYTNYGGRIYAKTGTLSNHVALSGYLITRKGKTLIFSVLVNAHQRSAGEVRKTIEKFLTGLIDKY